MSTSSLTSEAISCCTKGYKAFLA